LIILTVTGDEKYDKGEIKYQYLYLQILHLLVLSGSNIIILYQFFSLFEIRNRFSYIFIKYLALITYLCYVSYLYPVARAIIFNLIYDIIILNGFKSNFKILILIYSFTCFIIYYRNQFPTSLLLSYLFSLSLLLFNQYSLKISKLLSIRFIRFLVFTFYMTIVSTAISYFFFSNFSVTRSFISNIFIVPAYDFFVLVMYLAYFLGFIPFLNTALLPVLGFIIVILLTYLDYLSLIFKSYNL